MSNNPIALNQHLSTIVYSRKHLSISLLYKAISTYLLLQRKIAIISHWQSSCLP